MAKVATPKFDAWVAARWPYRAKQKARGRGKPGRAADRARAAEKRAEDRGVEIGSCVGEVADWLASAGGCSYCGAPRVGIDHVIPVSKGGAHTIENFQPLCRRCNSLKLDSTEAELLAHLEAVLPALREKLSCQIPTVTTSQPSESVV